MNEPQTATAQQFFKSPDATSEIEEETDGDGPEIKPAYIKEESTECCNTKPYTNTLKYVITLVIVSFGLVWGWQYIKREFENGV
jgi:hypothetical protein